MNRKNSYNSEIELFFVVVVVSLDRSTDLCCSFVSATCYYDQADFEFKLRQTLEGKAENAVLQSTTQRDQLLEDLLKLNSFGAIPI